MNPTGALGPASLVLSLMLYGCAPSIAAGAGSNDAPAASPESAVAHATTTRFQCGTLPVEARFAGEQLELSTPERAFFLEQVDSASGSRYAGSEVEFWEKGGRVQLTIGGTEYPECLRADLAHEGAEWVVEEIAGKSLLGSSRATLNFGANGRIWGQAGCNSYHGSFERSDTNISVGAIGATRKACARELMDQEGEFLRLLESADHFLIDRRGALVLSTLTGERIVAQRGDER